MKFVIKRDGRKIRFHDSKISDALNKAAEGTASDIKASDIKLVKDYVIELLDKADKEGFEVEEIQDIVVQALNEKGHHKLAKDYNLYRRERTHQRERRTDLMKVISKIGIETDRDNANVGNNFSAKLLRIASEANKWHVLLSVLPEHMAKAHELGDVYIHDLDSYNLTVNCLHIPTKKMLTEGFNTGYGTINPPKHIEVAAELLCIILQATQNDMFGGQSHPNFDNDLAPFVKLSRIEIERKFKDLGIPEKDLEKKIVHELIKKVNQAMQAVVYNLNTMHSRAGSQVPFSSINIGIPDSPEAAMICQSFLEQYLKGMGQGEQPIFPNIIFRVKKGINRDPKDPYYYLFQIACHVASQRMNPTFMNIDADFNKEYYDKGYMPATMGCRTYIMSNVNGEPGVEGRGNNAPATINLPRIAIMANGDLQKFWELFDEKIELAKDQLLHRHDVLKKLKVKDLPFVAGQRLMKGSENLSLEDSIGPIMKNGSWGIGFIGLAETLKSLLGKHHGESEEARELGLKIIGHLRDKCDEYKAKYKMNFSCYATPAEGLSGKFTKQDKVRFGNLPWIISKGFYTNSYHVPVDHPLSFAEKLEIEAPYHKLCNGGHISYVEFDSYPTGEMIENIVRWAYENTNINYIGMNFHIRYCRDCAAKANQERSHETV
ncbi:MAG: anaerobic ribonucleoside-triphosphate reductase [Mycoplasmataceae bacterium]|nr:anaerobic ribonucleoside-triphosphate reductase [Mycoplasmataceae bacterium]